MDHTWNTYYIKDGSKITVLTNGHGKEMLDVK